MTTKLQKRVFISSCIVFSILLSFFVIADFPDDLELEADVTRTILSVEADKDYIYLGETTAGYQTDLENVTLTNKGTRNVQIQLGLDESADEIFKDFLRFNRFANCASAGWRNLTSFDWILEKPEFYQGDPTPRNVCIKLDLRDYPGSINEDINIREDLTLWITPA